ncbi:MAG: hypothetical protein WCJ30_14965, partial [Deltaproteobacteria bacterium]
QTCAELGFHGGTTACAGGCQHDTSGCERCSSDVHVFACRAPAPAQAVAENFGLAANTDRIALAWVTVEPSGAGFENAGGTVQLQLLDASLAVVSRAPCLAAPGARSVSLVAVPGGWIAAYARGTPGGYTAVYAQRYDAMAQPAGGPAFVVEGSNPRLTAGDGTIVLLEYEIWSGGGNASAGAVILHSDGTAATLAQTVFEGIYSLDHEGAVWAGDAFMLAAREFRPPTDAEAVVRLERDGTISARTQPVGQATEYGQLAWDGSHVTLVYGSFGGAAVMRAQPLDMMGRNAGATIDLIAQGLIYIVAYPVWIGGGFAMLQSDRGGPWTLQAAPFDSSFHSLAAAWPVGRGGTFGLGDRVRTGVLGVAGTSERLVVGWTEMTPTGDRALALGVVAQ